MAKGKGLLRKLAESEEIEIETRRDPKSPLHRTTIWIVPTKKSVYVRSGSRNGRWYQEALANRNVTIRVGRRTAGLTPAQSAPRLKGCRIWRRSSSLGRYRATEVSAEVRVFGS